MGFSGRVAFWILPSQQSLLQHLLREYTKYTVCDAPYLIGVKLSSVTLSSHDSKEVHQMHRKQHSEGAPLGSLVTSMIISMCHTATTLDKVFQKVIPYPDVWWIGGLAFTHHITIGNPCPAWYC
jgi:hypothetical protein